MKYLIFMLSVFFITSCQSDSKEIFVVSIAIDMAVKDTNGNDLLDVKNPNALDQKSFKLFSDKDGQLVEVYNHNLDAPKGFRIYQHQNDFRIRITGVNTERSIAYPITYIQWSEADMDTLKCEIDRQENSETCKKVWFNNQLVWKAEDATERFFEITK